MQKYLDSLASFGVWVCANTGPLAGGAQPTALRIIQAIFSLRTTGWVPLF